jgi:nitroreductase/NAD-dependent dihydropyrimidine dehydrogenase PreA subunit
MKDAHTLHIDEKTCMGCGLCQQDCPSRNIVVQGKKAKVVTQDCILCGHCVAICPKAAVAMTGFDDPPLEIDGPTRLDPQQFLAALRSRRSIRQFTDRPVQPETMARILEAGRLTPTAGNAQDVSYLVLQRDMGVCEKEAVRLFRRLLPVFKCFLPMAKRMAIDEHFFFKNAPAALLVLSPERINGALAAGNMALMAEACGLGVLYSGFFSLAVNHSRRLRKRLGLRRRDRVITTLVVGYPDVVYRRTAPRERAVVRER